MRRVELRSFAASRVLKGIIPIMGRFRRRSSRLRTRSLATQRRMHTPARPAPRRITSPWLCKRGVFMCAEGEPLGRIADRRAKGHPELDLRYRDIEKILLRQPGEMDRALIAGAGVDAPPCCAISTISSHFSLNSRRTAESPPHASSGYPRSFRPQRDLSAAHTWGNCREAQAAAHIPAFPYARSVSPA